MSETRTNTAHKLPVEIVRNLFEVAATSRSMACVLVRVNKTVRDWINPILYRTIVLREDRHVRALLSSSYARDTLLPLIKNAYFGRGVTVKCLQNEVNKFRSLHHLAMHTRLLDAWTAPALDPAPTHITLMGPASKVNFAQPLFRHVTHLYYSDDVPGDGALQSLGSQMSASAGVLVLFRLSPHYIATGLRVMRISPGLDLQVGNMPGIELSVQGWEMSVDCGRGIWEAAEQKLSAKVNAESSYERS